MTEETKQLFDAPWTVTREEIRKNTVRYCVAKSHLDLVAIDLAHEDAHRLARLPELYDALMDMATEKCNEHAYRGEHACDSCVVKEYCDVFEIFDLLKKVREGE